MLAACRPTLCKGVENGSGTSSDREWNAQSNGGVTPDPYRTYTDLERIAIEPQLGREPVGLNRGMLGRCNPTTLCKSPNGAGSETYGPGQRYPAVEPEDNEADGDGYLLLEEDFENEEQDAATFVAELNTMKDTVRGLRKLLAGLLLLVLLLGLSVAFSVYSALPSAEKQETKVTTLLCSIPIVACLFTWFHIWLAIQMMFLPINFFGLYQYGNTGMGIGWQGIVPRKAHKMASTAYVSARPYLDGPRDWLTRVDSKGLIDQIRPQLHDLVKDSLAKVLITHFPTTSSFISDNMRANIATNAVDKIQASSNVLWGKWMDLLCDPDIGVDNDGLIVKIFTENKLLLNDFFMKLGAREFKFIEHCGATMGFFLWAHAADCFQQHESCRPCLLPASVWLFLGHHFELGGYHMCLQALLSCAGENLWLPHLRHPGSIFEATARCGCPLLQATLRTLLELPQDREPSEFEADTLGTVEG